MDFKDTEYGDLTGQTVDYEIEVDDTEIETLKGAPKVVKEGFYCNGCKKLKNLKGAPEKIIEGRFECSGCSSLETLEGAPKTVDGAFECSKCNKLKDLKGAPEKCVTFDCSFSKGIKNLIGIGDVEEIVACYNCDSLESLDGVPKGCKVIYCKRCPKLKNLNALLKCDMDKVDADKHLLEDYEKKKKIVDNHGYEKAMEIFNMLDDLA